jgi:hypothetical protein
MGGLKMSLGNAFLWGLLAGATALSVVIGLFKYLQRKIHRKSDPDPLQHKLDFSEEKKIVEEVEKRQEERKNTTMEERAQEATNRLRKVMK